MTKSVTTSAPMFPLGGCSAILFPQDVSAHDIVVVPGMGLCEVDAWNEGSLHQPDGTRGSATGHPTRIFPNIVLNPERRKKRA